MKKLFISLIIVLAFTATISAQITVNTAGNVGIGTVDPQHRLDVVGNARVTGNIYLGNASGFLGTAGNFSLIFKANNVSAGFTGNTSNSNVSFGYGALNNPLAGGDSNTATGYQALYSNRGYENTAFGSRALYFNNSGDRNVAIGAEALSQNTSGYENSAFGAYALSRNTSGNYNFAAGYMALADNTTGYDNTAIGAYAGLGPSNLYNATAIGNGAYVTASNQVRLGNPSVTSIGGQVAWTSLSDGRAKKNINADIPGLEFINRLQPVSYNLDLDAMDELLKSGDPKINAFRDSIHMAFSPEKKKLMEESRAKKESQVYSGFIAQDVEKIAQSIGYKFSGVDVPENENGLYGLRYAEFVVPLVKAVQELSAQNDAKDIAIASLQKQINELTGKSDAQEAIKSAVPAALPEMATGSASLEQNIPNPFNQNTVIKYYLPKTVTAAQLCVYDLNGKQLKQISLTGRGEGSQTISGSEFSAGIYLYALIADGQEVDVKRMILTE